MTYECIYNSFEIQILIKTLSKKIKSYQIDIYWKCSHGIYAASVHSILTNLNSHIGYDCKSETSECAYNSLQFMNRI